MFQSSVILLQNHPSTTVIPQTSTLPPGCEDYNVLNDSKRITTFYSKISGERKIDRIGLSNTSQDWKGKGWYRVISPAGTKIASGKIYFYHCRTVGGITIQGDHPEKVGQTVVSKACYYYQASDGECYQPHEVEIRHCGEYFLYYLSGTETGTTRYCTN